MSETSDWHLLQRCVLTTDPERAPLYARGGSPLSRTSLVLAPGETVSYATYFGAFPGGYWARYTGVSDVRVAVTIDGSASVSVCRTDANGRPSVATTASDAAGGTVVSTSVDVNTGWVWLEVTAGADGATVSDVMWETNRAPRSDVSVTIAITTFDREEDCLRLLGRLVDPEVRSSVERVVVVDQGTRRLRDAHGFAEASARLGDALRLVEQPNLGGSGGFSRGMVEALDEQSSHVLLLDDDVDLEPESLDRVARFAAHADGPLLVGAQMLSLIDPTILHSFGEHVARRGFWWEPVEPSLSSVDLARATVENTPALSRRIDVDFNGWWMCLVPSAVVEDVGASLPLFIKWDDAEFGLRAAEAGVRTVTLPGAALWHMPWTAKDDGLDWQAYFQLRNRLVAALIHAGRRGSGVIGSSFLQDINHLLCAQYGSVVVRNQALRDILDGPEHLERTLREGPGRPARLLAGERQVVVPVAKLPETRPTTVMRPSGVMSMVARAGQVVVHQLRRPRPSTKPVRLPRVDGKWWSLGVLDTAIVEAASGRGAFVAVRDRSRARRLLWQAVALRMRLWATWPGRAREYRAAAPALASPAAWRERLAQSGAQDL
ncbi:glycosyltransferase [Microbacterium ureisolvens]|uniref:glycosyltransferase n=1 Tax=Microbacterium ureisolvens TaxID=2781186 RepID=UPI00363035C6